MARYLISGSSGFIGQALSKALSRKGHQVVALPRELLFRDPALPKFLKEVNPEVIVHLASYGNKYDQTDEEMIFKVNIKGFWHLLQASKEIPYKAFINVGSSSEYGTKQKYMQESDSLETDTFYGVTKASATLLCRAFAKKYDKPIVTVRPFSVYGPTDDPSKFIQTAIRCFKDNQKLNLASGMHDWIYIDDFIQGLMLVIKNVGQLKGRVINIGTGEQYSNLEIIAILRDLFSKPGIIKNVDQLRDYDTTKYWVADNSLLSSLGWEQKYTLEEGLERCMYGYKK